jgi:hypothetical protein
MLQKLAGAINVKQLFGDSCAKGVLDNVGTDQLKAAAGQSGGGESPTQSPAEQYGSPLPASFQVGPQMAPPSLNNTGGGVYGPQLPSTGISPTPETYGPSLPVPAYTTPTISTTMPRA